MKAARSRKKSPRPKGRDRSPLAPTTVAGPDRRKGGKARRGGGPPSQTSSGRGSPSEGRRASRRRAQKARTSRRQTNSSGRQPKTDKTDKGWNRPAGRTKPKGASRHAHNGHTTSIGTRSDGEPGQQPGGGTVPHRGVNQYPEAPKTQPKERQGL